MQLTNENREKLTAELNAAKREQARCMGGVDIAGCVLASKEITRLRSALRDDQGLISHFATIAAEPRRAKRR